jgi:hypothetical protein
MNWILISLTVLPSQDLEVKYIGGIDPRMLFLQDGKETEVRCGFNHIYTAFWSVILDVFYHMH